MSTRIKVKYGPDDPEVHELTLRSINIFAHRGERDVHVVESPKPVRVIQSPETLEEGRTMETPHWAFWVFWEILRDPGGIEHLPKTIEEIKRSGTGFTHLAGLVNLFVKATFEDDVLPFLRYPEARLHPSAQAALADMVIAMQQPIRAVVFHLTNGRSPILALPKELIADEEDSQDDSGQV
jgi:hypothetical protein